MTTTPSSTLAELFARDPLSLTKPDIGVIVHYYRENRAKFNLGDNKAGKAPKAKTEKATSLNLDELDL